VLLAVGCAAAIVGVWSALQLFGQDNAVRVADSVYQVATVFPQPRTLPAVNFTDQDEQAFTVERLAGHWTLLFMGFTNCGHICPMTMAKMRVIASELNGAVDVVFVSVDPGRDTPMVIRDYVRSFDANFTGITGTKAELDKLANALGAPLVVDVSADNYIVDHSSALFLLDPNGAFAGVVSAPLDVDLIVADLRHLLNTAI